MARGPPCRLCPYSCSTHPWGQGAGACRAGPCIYTTAVMCRGVHAHMPASTLIMVMDGHTGVVYRIWYMHGRARPRRPGSPYDRPPAARGPRSARRRMLAWLTSIDIVNMRRCAGSAAAAMCAPPLIAKRLVRTKPRTKCCGKQTGSADSQALCFLADQL